MKNLLLIFIIFTSLKANATNLSFLAFGDSGYHEDFQKADEKNGLPLSEWKEEAIEDGDVLNGKPVLPLLSPGKKKGHFVEKSGARLVGKAMARFCKTATCEFAIALGDNIYPQGAEPDGRNKERFHKMFYLPFKDIEKNNKTFRFYAALGNHDWKISQELEWAPAQVRLKNSQQGIRDQLSYMARKDNRWLFNPPSKDPDRKTYWKFTRGDAEFFVIDTDRMLAAALVQDNDEPKKFDRADAPATLNHLYHQLRWLKKSLENSKAKWKIVYGHHTLWSVGGSKYFQAKALRNMILKRLCQYADMYIAGHEHDLEFHMAPCRKGPKLPLIVSGAASKMRSVGLSPMSKELIRRQQNSFGYAKGMIFGFTHLTLKDKMAKIKLISVDQKGYYRVIFERNIKKRL